MLRGYERLIALLRGYAGVLILAMLGVVLLGVTFRYLVGQALSWYDEFAGYLLVWLTMYGSVVALADGKHISFETLVEKLPPAGKRAVEIFAALCVLGFSLVLLVSGWVLVRAMADETAISLPGVKMAWVYSVLPISGGLLVLVGVVQLVGLFSGRDLRGAGTPKATPKSMDEGQ
jgi:TRAP-type C4-dicarboxylate transport system permease small subunit